MKRLLMATAIAALATAPLSPALAWFRGTEGGSYSHTSLSGDRSTSASASGWSHSADYGGRERSSSGNWEGSAEHSASYGGYSRSTAVGPSGWEHSSDYGGYYHGTSGNFEGTATHTGYYGTSTASYGNYYHQPATVGYYGAQCYNCGSGGWGAAAAGAAATSAAYAGAAAVPPPGAYVPAAAPPPAAYAVLPTGCAYRPVLRRYECPGGVWLTPAYGANGIHYQPVPPP